MIWLINVKNKNLNFKYLDTCFFPKMRFWSSARLNWRIRSFDIDNSAIPTSCDPFLKPLKTDEGCFHSPQPIVQRGKMQIGKYFQNPVAISHEAMKISPRHVVSWWFRICSKSWMYSNFFRHEKLGKISFKHGSGTSKVLWSSPPFSGMLCWT